MEWQTFQQIIEKVAFAAIKKGDREKTNQQNSENKFAFIQCMRDRSV